ncbi:MAG: copper amine oxidase N-terminal domain-containing protein [Symbiobacteriaceae bacterium]|nr:copper amine oxidase N-terminal domain-containing protein [Symbiobacteriaceae bacterium]
MPKLHYRLILYSFVLFLAMTFFSGEAAAIPLPGGEPPVKFEVDAWIDPTTFMASSYIKELPFTITTNGVPIIPAKLTVNYFLEVTHPSGAKRVYGGDIINNSIVFKGTVPAVVGSYTLKYYGGVDALNLDNYISGAVQLPVSYRTPTVIEVGNAYSVYDVQLSQAPMQNDYDVVISGRVTTADGSTPSYRPTFSVEGSSIVSESYDRGFFSIRLGRITGSGNDGLRLMADGVEVSSWPVGIKPLAAYTFSPGSLCEEMQQSIIATASYWNGSTLMELSDSNLMVTLSGVPIYNSGAIPYYRADYGYYGSDTFSRIEILARNLSNTILTFADYGTLLVTLHSNDYYYQSSFSVQVERFYTRDLCGGPAIMSYAGMNSLSMTLHPEPGRPVSEYWGTVVLADGTVRNIQNSSSAAIYNLTQVPFLANGSGSIVVEVNCLDRNGDTWSARRIFDYDLPSVQLSDNIFELGQSATLYLSLQNAQGRGIAGATVSVMGIGTMRSVSGSAGEYYLESSWNNPGYHTIEVIDYDGNLLAYIEDYLFVRPPENLTLEAETLTFMGGVENQFRFKVYDQNGREFTGSGVRFSVWADDELVNTTATWDGSYYVLRARAWEKLVVRAESSDGRRFSPSLTIKGQGPKVEVKHDGFANGFIQKLELQFFHPTSGAAINGTVTYRGNNLDVETRNAKSNGSSSSSGSQFTVDVYPKVKNQANEAFFIVDFRYNNHTYSEVWSYKVEEPKVTSRPEQLQSGMMQSATLKLTAVDGTNLAGVTVRSSNNAEQKQTAANGEVTFNIVAGNTDYIFTIQRQVQASAGGSYSDTFTYAIPTQQDSVPPRVTIRDVSGLSVETSANPYNLHLEFADNLELDCFYLKNEKHPLSGSNDSWSGVITLVEGRNEIPVSVYDTSGNRIDVTILINYTNPAKSAVRLVIGSGIVHRGDEVLDPPQVPPMIINGRTMLPFRYLCQTVLQGMVDYVAETQRIIAYVQGHEVIMHVDNPVFYVDGLEKVLTQAPTIVNDFTMVPVRAFDGIVSDIQWDEDSQTVTIIP